MQKQKMVINLKNQAAQLDILHEKIEEFGKSMDWPMRVLFQVKLALEEVFINIVEHGCKKGCKQMITIVMSQSGDDLTVTMEDDGIAFDPNSLDAPDLSTPVWERMPGGLGVHLAKCTCKLNYFRRGPKNVLTMKRSISESLCEINNEGKNENNPGKQK